MIRKSILAACLALAAIGGSALVASPALAANPGGNDCATGISGHGSTFETKAQQLVFIPTFLNGAAAAGHAACTTGKVQYNWAGVATGSGAGRRGQGCRSDFFGGTDSPYDTASFSNFNAAAGTGQSCGAEVAAPFAPNTPPFPAAGSGTATILTVPVAISSEVVAFNLPCVGTFQPQFTNVMVSQLFGGDIKTWDDARLNTNGKNKTLITNCHGAVTRAVRSDSSGTTQVFKNYVRNIDQNRNTGTGYTCDTGNAWQNLWLDANNQRWPGQTTPGVSQGATGTCTAISTGNGNPGVATVVNTTVGAVGYIDLADAELNLTTKTWAKVQAAGSSAYNKPDAKTKANCNPTTFSLTAGDPLGRGADTYASDQLDVTNPAYDQPASRSTTDISALGTKYPICGVAYIIVYPGSSGAQVGINVDQKQTMYDFVTNSKYGILSKLAQGGKGLGANFYVGLSAKELKPLITAFQAAY